jgi:hypothetical protein
VSVEHPRLHVPSEPADKAIWYATVLGGTDLAQVVEGDGGIAGWLWDRWRVLGSVGLDRTSFIGLTLAYRRELWLWLAGERTWEQCCSGLIGRIDRRLGS